MRNTRSVEKLGGVLVELIGFLNSPRRDHALLREAGIGLDRALFPLLVALGAQGAQSVAELAHRVGRDYTTISRQLAKLERSRLVERGDDEADRRRCRIVLTSHGRKTVKAITLARQRLLSAVLAGWSESDRRALADMNRRLADALMAYARQREERE